MKNQRIYAIIPLKGTHAERSRAMKTHNGLYKLILSALFLALAYTLPFLTGQIPAFGAMLCPMHIPVLLCGFICGWPWGLLVGFIAPLFRSLTLGMPTLFPKALAMAFELMTYGAVAGLLHRLLPKKKPFIYCSLLVSMLTGRLVWGAAMFISLSATGNIFTFSAFLAGAFTNAIPAIIVQLTLIPLLVILLEHPKIRRSRGKSR